MYLPERWPRLDREELTALQGASYQELAAQVLAPFVDDDLSEAEPRDLIARAYVGFVVVAALPARAERMAARAVPRADARLQ